MAAISNYNIKQITNFDINDEDYTITYNITIPVIINGEITYKTKAVKYATIISNANVIKLGYCCNLSSIIYPIYLEINGSYKKIEIGKEGMYEMQPEALKNESLKETDVIITGVRVPKDVDFTLEYIIAET